MAFISVWQELFDFLKDKGFEVYSPGVKVGECKSKYIVVKNDGSNRNTSYSTNDDLYSIMCYVPEKRYSQLEVFVMEVLKAMKGIEPMLRPAGNQTPSYHDQEIKAHMISISYKNYKKML